MSVVARLSDDSLSKPGGGCLASFGYKSCTQGFGTRLANLGVWENAGLSFGMGSPDICWASKSIGRCNISLDRSWCKPEVLKDFVYLMSKRACPCHSKRDFEGCSRTGNSPGVKESVGSRGYQAPCFAAQETRVHRFHVVLNADHFF